MKARSRKAALDAIRNPVVKAKSPVPTDPMAVAPTPKRAKQGASTRDRQISDPVSKDRGRPRIRYQVPAVARYIARVVLKNAMDYEDAIREIAAGRFDEMSIHSLAENIEKSPEVQSALEEILTVHGLDETSKTAFVKEMWDWLRSDDVELKKKAAQVLGRGFIAEKAENEKPLTLPIAGLDTAVASMLGSKKVPESANDEPIPEPDGQVN